VAQISRGELLAIAAGDDISLPHRVTDTVKAWVCGNRTHFSLHSAMFTMDENSRINAQKLEPSLHTLNLERWDDRPMAVECGPGKGAQIVGLVRSLRYVYGASQTVHRDLFQRFGPVDPAIIHEDIILPFRASLLGGIRFIERPLGIYREHSQGISQIRRSRLEAAVFYSRCRIPICQQMLRDLKAIAFPDPVVAEEVARMEARMQLMYDLNTCAFRRRPAHLAKALRRGVGAGYCARQFVKSFVLAALN
jgi:hypothetical protein